MSVITTCTPEISEQLFDFICIAASDAQVKSAVEDNHDSNRWWPPTIQDWRLRLVIAGWSARISYSMIDTYARVVRSANVIGFDALTAMTDGELDMVIGPLGLRTARRTYLRSVAEFVERLGPTGEAQMLADPDAFIHQFAAEVSYASFKVAQCATLYASGYHCGVIPVDSGMVEKLAPCLGWHFSKGPVAHQQMRVVLETAAKTEADRYGALVRDLDYRVTIPASADPTWWVHLVLIYYKRFYCTYRQPRHCPGDGLACTPSCRGRHALDTPTMFTPTAAHKSS